MNWNNEHTTTMKNSSKLYFKSFRTMLVDKKEYIIQMKQMKKEGKVYSSFWLKYQYSRLWEYKFKPSLQHNDVVEMIKK